MILALTRARQRRGSRFLREVKPRPVRAVVDMLDQVQEQAQAGQVVAVALVIVERNGAIGTTWTEGNDWAQLLAGACCLRARLEDVT